MARFALKVYDNSLAYSNRIQLRFTKIFNK